MHNVNVLGNWLCTRFWLTATFWRPFQCHCFPSRIWQNWISATMFSAPFQTRWAQNWPIWLIWFCETTYWPIQISQKIWAVWPNRWSTLTCLGTTLLPYLHPFYNSQVANGHIIYFYSSNYNNNIIDKCKWSNEHNLCLVGPNGITFWF